METSLQGELTEFHEPLGSFDERPSADQVNALFKAASAEYAENVKDEWKGEPKAKWLAEVDPDSGDTYYWNSITKEVSWTNPDDPDHDEAEAEAA